MPTSVCEVTGQVWDQVTRQMLGQCSLTRLVEGWSVTDLFEYGSLSFAVSAAVGLSGYAVLWAVKYGAQVRANRLRNLASQERIPLQMLSQDGGGRTLENQNHIAMVDVVEVGKVSPEDKSGQDRLEGLGLPPLGQEQEQSADLGGARVRVEDVGLEGITAQELLEREREKLRLRRLENTAAGRSLADELPTGDVGGRRGGVAAPRIRPLEKELPDGAVGGGVPAPPLGTSPAKPVGAVKPSGANWAFTARPILTKVDRFGRTVFAQAGSTGRGGQLSAAYSRRQRAGASNGRGHQERVVLRDDADPIVDTDALWQDSTVDDTMEEVELVNDFAPVEQMEE